MAMTIKLPEDLKRRVRVAARIDPPSRSCCGRWRPRASMLRALAALEAQTRLAEPRARRVHGANPWRALDGRLLQFLTGNQATPAEIIADGVDILERHPRSRARSSTGCASC